MEGDRVFAYRTEKSQPIVSQLKTWLNEKTIKTLPKSSLGKAMLYTLK